MRLVSAITATFLIVFALPAASRADGTPPQPAAGAPAAPDCHCPRPHRVVRHFARRHYRHRFAVARPAPYWASNYNPLLPISWDTAYDRAMTIHFRSPAVTGLYNPDPGYPPTPPVAGVYPYRVPAFAGIYQYDGLIGQYVRLAQIDAARSGMAIPPPAPPPAPR